MSKLFAKLFLFSAVIFLTGASCVSFPGTSSKKSTPTGPTGWFFSKDSGESWKPMVLLPTADGVKSLSAVSVYALVEDKNDPKALYWLSRDNGLLYSYDDGATWQKSVEPVGSGFIYSIAIHPTDKCTIFATNGRQIFKTTDCNRSWTEMYREGVPSRTIKSLAINISPPFELYALEANGILLKSLDSGASWQIGHDFKEPTEKMIFDNNKAGLVYVATKENGLIRSRDSGVTWFNLKNSLKSFPGATQYRRLYLYPTQGEQVYWVSKYGILVSKNAGDDWDPINLITPPGGTSIYGFAVNPKNEKEIYYTSTIGTRSTFYRTIDGGKTWVTRKLPSSQIPVILRIHPNNPSWLYLGYTAMSN
ncbi:MAG: hypothetical protein A2821_02655 [Candidatus Magasanikbacteria bacterium RIFCSPHIGHO2_01_FULL_41_23]|uniref:Sortilin N-terminal domain-containing protein n=1 Tax=Candidatus Magasanikbacteria bacterium RIFCSPLOWO2_01_FULL_40_15 TaxID=1798686 RepID=A0A1F6N2Q8_9BACT|nr:MAG: hypothetical protein A2821_02655 [Candidatus Magasanikbacteria bacterium RIFCSPHIGHO2_01_FULL_41_23]OGH66907.1 MAG: hypothetical protein A3C66_02435 [Candidatus Magasanikbacteria bacterium RIFCSPHIGHO2_02_FULL_41_35]OGH74891.1 MAG: hypothetical protein A3F22_04365 [Candidatus Magasanikbacteria bacterium RIFCSPHIGHO2_12_FULL_41_16]OGH78164.1 MAG: hypothetical protein A2983_03780 [Candidatus Magasanikbacteria bacterium RIFCSPLOWO2_01_FULL_40_15]